MKYLDDGLLRVVLYQDIAELKRLFFHNPLALSQKKMVTVRDIVSKIDRDELIEYLIQNEFLGEPLGTTADTSLCLSAGKSATRLDASR